MLNTHYRVKNLQELIETCAAIQEEVNATAGRSVHPSEILVNGEQVTQIQLWLSENALMDTSCVYNVTVWA